MNPLGVLMDELNNNGASMELKRQMNDGSLQSTRPNELATINTKARIATTAQLLKNLNKEDKLQWALLTKNEGNELYKNGNCNGAIEKYMETLSAADFGSSDGGNVDSLLIPVLCNLAACCIQLQQWQKVVLFTEQALKLRPKCQKAKFRQGIGYMNTGEYDLAIQLFKELMNEPILEKRCEDDEDSHSSRNEFEEVGTVLNSMNLTSKEIDKLPKLLLQAQQHRKRQVQSFNSQKEALRKAFQSSVYMGDGDGDGVTEKQKLQESKLKPLQPETTLEYIVVFIALVVKYLYALFTNHLQRAPSSSSANASQTNRGTAER